MPLCGDDWHHEVIWKVEPHEEEDRYGHTEGVYCTVCGSYLHSRFAFHEWSEWTVTREATAEDEGEETRTCSVCEKTETRPVGKQTGDNGGIRNAIEKALTAIIKWFKKLLNFFNR